MGKLCNSLPSLIGGIERKTKIVVLQMNCLKLPNDNTKKYSSLLMKLSIPENKWKNQTIE